MLEQKKTFYKKICGVLISTLAVAAIGSGCANQQPPTQANNDASAPSVSSDNTGDANTPAQQTSTSSNNSSVETGEKNVVDEATAYLASMTFSRQGLLEQLQADGFSAEEATQGVDNCGADWNEQALIAAQSYVDTDVLSFSHDGLIAQLTADGFTDDEAVYGVDNCTADWNAQAVKKAKEYKDMGSYTKEQALEQLGLDGFTAEQARHGATEAGF